MRTLALLSALALAACGGSSPDFEQKGYFKSESKARLMTFSMPVDATVEQVSNHAKTRMHTKGLPTASYYWPEGAHIPAMEISREADFFAATDLVHSPAYDPYVFLGVISPNGEFSFYDCRPPDPDEICGGD